MMHQLLIERSYSVQQKKTKDFSMKKTKEFLRSQKNVEHTKPALKSLENVLYIINAFNSF